MEPILTYRGASEDLSCKEGFVVYLQERGVKNKEEERVRYIARKSYGSRFPNYNWIVVFPQGAYFEELDGINPQFYFGGVNKGRVEFLQDLQERHPDDFYFLLWRPELLAGRWIS